MLIIRPVEAKDLDDLYDLAIKAGTGLTTLPAHRDALQEKIDASAAAFAAEDGLEQKHTYFLVMEDLNTGKVVGTSAIIAGVGLDKPFYSYRLLHLTQVSHDPEMRVDTEMLQLSNDYVGATEMATLFLDPDYRKGANGRFLAKARYLLIAAQSDRFTDMVISEIRGWVDEQEQSPFWDAVGRHFFSMEFKEADEINGRGNSQFIADMMPKFPIYTALLPDSARAVIGKPHDSARAAIKLLEKEGFRFAGAVDIFDAGPALEVHKNAIATTRSAFGGPLAGTVAGEGQAIDHLVSNISLDSYRVVLTSVVDTNSGLWLPEAAAEALQVKAGDEILCAPLNPESGRRREDA